MNKTRPAGVILAGGRSRRVGEVRKALLPLNGKPLLAHVIERLQPQLGQLMLNFEGESRDFDHFDLPLVPDLLPGFRGPLMGLYSALQQLCDNDQVGALVLCPCDAPFIPCDLVTKLQAAVQGDKHLVVVVSYQGVLQPTFSLWQSHHLPGIHSAVVEHGQGGIRKLLLALPHTVVEWPEAEPSPFF